MTQRSTPEAATERHTENLANLERHYRQGELAYDRYRALIDAVLYCFREKLPPPGWVANGVETACGILSDADRQRAARRTAQLHKDRMRWAAVLYFHTAEGASWEDSYERSAQALRATRYKASAETMKASYQKHARHYRPIYLDEEHMIEAAKQFYKEIIAEKVGSSP
jgi:hypothetical protein